MMVKKSRRLGLLTSSCLVLSTQIGAEVSDVTWLANGLSLPFGQNQTWYVCQGYLSTLTNTHTNNYAFDLTKDPNGIGQAGCYGNTNYSAGETVYAPGPGVVSEYHRSNPALDDMVCLDLEVGGSLLIGHVTPSSRVLGTVTRGQQIAVLAQSSTGGGGVDNGGYAHMHIQAYGNNNCTGSAQPFAGTYRFMGVPNLVDQQSLSATPNYKNQYFGMGISNLKIMTAQDDAGVHGGDCAESANANEIYVGNCSDKRKIHSGLRFENLPIEQGDWVSSAKLLAQSDSPYTLVAVTDIRSQNHSNPPAFTSSSLPSTRLNDLTSIVAQWRLTSQLAGNTVKTEESPELKGSVQSVVNRGDWIRDNNHLAFILSATYNTTSNHRRFMAFERNPNQTIPALAPAKLVVTQFRTRDESGVYKGNNYPIANAGEDIEYDGINQSIVLDGANSSDPDNDTITFNWKQIRGPSVQLHAPKTATPYFNTGTATGYFTFELSVTDNGTGLLMGKDTVNVYSGCSEQC